MPLPNISTLTPMSLAEEQNILLAEYEHYTTFELEEIVNAQARYSALEVKCALEVLNERNLDNHGLLAFSPEKIKETNDAKLLEILKNKESWTTETITNIENELLIRIQKSGQSSTGQSKPTKTTFLTITILILVLGIVIFIGFATGFFQVLLWLIILFFIGIREAIFGFII